MNEDRKRQVPTHEELVHELFEDGLNQHNDDVKEAAVQVLSYLAEAVALAANIASGDNEVIRTGLLKRVAEQIKILTAVSPGSPAPAAKAAPATPSSPPSPATR